ncbi:Hypothetical protein SMAX5B_006799 [Scophthalmus maximus]|uniref:Uncharacterized protein n=1 Tax=Scophthalmus maximus TaxID=52904 RepID=A0A2U9B7S8_SCOMX|nr:Hypothetical protein SMAX5B_006799 [Scophthalmus maximus]
MHIPKHTHNHAALCQQDACVTGKALLDNLTFDECFALVEQEYRQIPKPP